MEEYLWVIRDIHYLSSSLTLSKRLCDDGRIYGVKIFTKFLLIFREVSLCKCEDKMGSWVHDLPSEHYH